MAETVAIKAIEASTVHQIQSGQVIVDLCSVAKELVENSLDAGATSIGRFSPAYADIVDTAHTVVPEEIRFKNQGLDAIEVQDNGSGISPKNYEALALKHHTSKLSNYADLTTLQTFGFRGEALSSLCALSHFTVATCTESDVPRGTKLEFETSGKLKGTGVVASQKGTTVTVETLFKSLPVRRRELERNIKREWGKVINLLNQYACVQAGVKFTVSQQPNKGKRIVLFSTKGNATTRENIINIFGAKTMNALIALDLLLELEPSSGPSQKWTVQGDGSTQEIHIRGHVSRPTHGDGRQTPDRQMFYVNGRPCQLPQFAKVFNEVYKSYNTSQSPFIFADIQLDTHLYDVNVSPDKRTILLHDQGRMLDSLRESLVELFEKQDITVPISLASGQKPNPFKKPSLSRQATSTSERGSVVRGSTTDHDGVVSEDEKRTSNTTIDHNGEDSSSGSDRQRQKNAKSSASRRSKSKNDQGVNLISHWVERKSDGRIENKGVDSQAQSGVAADTELREEVEVAERLLRANTPNGHESRESEETDEEGGSQTSTPEPPNRAGVDALRAGEPRGALTSSRVPSVNAEDADSPPSAQDSATWRHNDTSIFSEPPIPALDTPSRTQMPRITNTSFVRPPKRSSQETAATITIGDHTVTSILGSTPKRQRTVEASGQNKSRSGKQPVAPLPSFHGRLTQKFAAAGSIVTLADDTIESAADDDDDEDIEDQLLSPADEAGQESSIADNESIKSVEDDQESGATSEHGEKENDQHTPSSHGDTPSDDEEYMDDGEKISREESKGEESRAGAEDTADNATEETEKRSQAFFKAGARKKDSTLRYVQHSRADEASIDMSHQSWQRSLAGFGARSVNQPATNGLDAEDAEEKLSLIISKADFGRMKVVGQFNLGFVLAIRESDNNSDDTASRPQDDELFIIDQHASDEKYNFERLQANTIVQSQRLVRPKVLELTAVEEEIVIENKEALEANGFIVSVDESGEVPVGSRCQLLSLPLSRETTFSLADLEELISLLGDRSSATTVPRPSKVRKMFAMRACRSSIMIGKALSDKQMERVIRHMGEMEKPWNCPHGRPTMRHLCSLSTCHDQAWLEGDDFDGRATPTNWTAWIRKTEARV